MPLFTETSLETVPTLTEILKSSDYALDIFSEEEINSLELFYKKGKPCLKNLSGKTERPAKPEEIVRQLFLYRLMHTCEEMILA